MFGLGLSAEAGILALSVVVVDELQLLINADEILLPALLDEEKEKASWATGERQRPACKWIFDDLERVDGGK
jgi:hypothetical protein